MQRRFHLWRIRWGDVKAATLTTLLVAGVGGAAVSGWLLFEKQRANAAIDRMRTGTEIPVDASSAQPALLEARAAFLLRRNRIDEAQPVLDEAAERAPADVNVRMLYNMGNARLRAAIAAIEKGDYDKAIPLVTLAKSEYRAALRFDPADWDAKYNFDVAMRLVRDLPQAVGEDEEKPLETPDKLWTDLPGAPKGLP